MVFRVVFFSVVYTALMWVAHTAFPDTYSLSLRGWATTILGFWIAHLLIDGYRRAQVVTSIVWVWTTGNGVLRGRWHGSRARLWLALFIIGHAANTHGQSVSFERGGE